MRRTPGKLQEPHEHQETHESSEPPEPRKSPESHESHKPHEPHEPHEPPEPRLFRSDGKSKAVPSDAVGPTPVDLPGLAQALDERIAQKFERLEPGEKLGMFLAGAVAFALFVFITFFTATSLVYERSAMRTFGTKALNRVFPFVWLGGTGLLVGVALGLRRAFPRDLAADLDPMLGTPKWLFLSDLYCSLVLFLPESGLSMMREAVFPARRHELGLLPAAVFVLLAQGENPLAKEFATHLRALAGQYPRVHLIQSFSLLLKHHFMRKEKKTNPQGAILETFVLTREGTRLATEFSLVPGKKPHDRA
jgi:hypothetical protein